MNTKGINALNTILGKKKNCILLSNSIRKSIKNDEEYMIQVYDTIGELLHKGKTKQALYSIREDIEKGNTQWSMDLFEEYKQNLNDMEFSLNDIEIQEGVLECFKCGGKKTISYQKQTRSADEGATTFARCVECNNNWRHNN